MGRPRLTGQTIPGQTRLSRVTKVSLFFRFFRERNFRRIEKCKNPWRAAAPQKEREREREVREHKGETTPVAGARVCKEITVSRGCTKRGHRDEQIHWWILLYIKCCDDCCCPLARGCKDPLPSPPFFRVIPAPSHQPPLLLSRTNHVPLRIIVVIPLFFFFFEIRQNTLLLLLRDYFSRFNRLCRSRRDRSCWITSREKPIKHGSFFLSFSTPGSTHFFFFFFHSRDRLLNFFSLFACELFSTQAFQ